MAEEVQHDLDAAIAAYQSVIAQHDDQRRLVATALFRLGESYRKQGKTAEAVAQYQRLVAEFGDQSELARLSRQKLEQLAPGTPAFAVDPLPAAMQRQKELLEEELALVEKQVADVRMQISVGRADPSDLIPFQREALSLQRQMAQLEASSRGDLLMDLGEGEPAVVGETSDVISDEERNEIERVKLLIRDSPDLVNAVSPDSGLAPLQVACVRGGYEMASLLLERGAGKETTGSEQLKVVPEP